MPYYKNLVKIYHLDNAIGELTPYAFWQIINFSFTKEVDNCFNDS